MEERTTQQVKVAPRKRKLAWLWIALAALVIVLVAGAAFMGGQLLAGGWATLARERKPVDMAELGGSEESVEAMVSITVPSLPSELPERPSEAHGLVKRITGDGFILFVPEFKITGGVGVATGGGRELEIVTTRDTLVYSMALGEQGEEWELEECAAEDIEEGVHVLVWGRKRGDRIVAEVVAKTIIPPPSP